MNLWLLILLLLCPLPVGAAEIFLNSSETGCDGSDSNVLLCFDWEDGNWMQTFADRTHTGNNGWAETAFADGCPTPNGCLPGTVITPTFDSNNFARCGSAGVAGTNCAAYTGIRPNGTEGQTPGQADHNFATCVDEFYIRWYVKYTSASRFSDNYKIQFSLNPIEPSSGAIAGIVWSHNDQDGGFTPYTAINYGLTAHNPNDNRNIGQNQGVDLGVTTNDHWYFVEQHFKMNVPNGTFNGEWDLWVNDCGTNGLGCTGSATLRAHHTNILWRSSDWHPTDQFCNVWFENYTSGVPTQGPMDAYYDQLKASKVGPIGFMSTSGSVPSAPTNFRFIILLLGLLGAGILGGVIYGSNAPTWLGGCARALRHHIREGRSAAFPDREKA